MNIETIAISINRQDIPERGYLYMYETEIPMMLNLAKNLFILLTVLKKIFIQ